MPCFLKGWRGLQRGALCHGMGGPAPQKCEVVLALLVAGTTSLGEVRPSSPPPPTDSDVRCRSN